MEYCPHVWVCSVCVGKELGHGLLLSLEKRAQERGRRVDGEFVHFMGAAVAAQSKHTICICNFATHIFRHGLEP